MNNTGKMNRCIVKWCKSRSNMHKDVTFFPFPKDSARRHMWLNNCSRMDLIQQGVENLSKSTRICSKHFDKKMLKNRLQTCAVPTIFDVDPLSREKQPIRLFIDSDAVPSRNEQANEEVNISFSEKNPQRVNEELDERTTDIPEETSILKRALTTKIELTLPSAKYLNSTNTLQMNQSLPVMTKIKHTQPPLIKIIPSKRFDVVESKIVTKIELPRCDLGAKLIKVEPLSKKVVQKVRKVVPTKKTSAAKTKKKKVAPNLKIDKICPKKKIVTVKVYPPAKKHKIT